MNYFCQCGWKILALLILRWVGQWEGQKQMCQNVRLVAWVKSDFV